MSLLENVSRVYWKITGSATTNLSGSGVPEDPFMLPSAGARQTALRNAARALYDQTATNGGLTAPGTNYDIPSPVVPAVTVKEVLTDETIYSSGLAASVTFGDTSVGSGATIMYSQRPDQETSSSNEFLDHPGRVLTAAGLSQAQDYWDDAVTWLTSKGHVDNANNPIIIDIERWAPAWRQAGMFSPYTDQTTFKAWAKGQFAWLRGLSSTALNAASERLYNLSNRIFFGMGITTLDASYPLSPKYIYAFTPGTSYSASAAPGQAAYIVDIYKKEMRDIMQRLSGPLTPLYINRQVAAVPTDSGQVTQANFDAFYDETIGINVDIATHYGTTPAAIFWPRYTGLAGSSRAVSFATIAEQQTARDKAEAAGIALHFEWEDWSTTSQAARGLSGAAMKAEYEAEYSASIEPIHIRQVAEP